MATFTVFSSLLLALILLSSSTVQVRCQYDEEAAVLQFIEGIDLGVIGDDTHVHDETNLSPAPGISTVCLFLNNPGKLVFAGERTDLLVGLHNEGDSIVKVSKVLATLHLPFDHRIYSQNLTLRAFSNAKVPISTQATFPYAFYLSNLLWAGSYDLVGYIIYEIDQQLYQSIFYNATIEVIKSEGFLSIESIFLLALGVALVGLLGLWLYSQLKQYQKKLKRTPKVEVGMQRTEANIDEWLEGTAYACIAGKEKKNK